MKNLIRFGTSVFFCLILSCASSTEPSSSSGNESGDSPSNLSAGSITTLDLGGSDVGNPSSSSSTLQFTSYSTAKLNSETPEVTYSKIQLRLDDFNLDPCETSTATLNLTGGFEIDLVSSMFAGDLPSVSSSPGFVCKGSIHFAAESDLPVINLEGELEDGTLVEVSIDELNGVNLKQKNGEVELSGEDPLAIMIAADTDTWITSENLKKAKVVDGKIMISRGSNNSILSRIQNNIRASFRLHKDENKNKKIEIEDANSVLMDQE